MRAINHRGKIARHFSISRKRILLTSVFHFHCYLAPPLCPSSRTFSPRPSWRFLCAFGRYRDNKRIPNRFAYSLSFASRFSSLNPSFLRSEEEGGRGGGGRRGNGSAWSRTMSHVVLLFRRPDVCIAGYDGFEATKARCLIHERFTCRSLLDRRR